MFAAKPILFSEPPTSPFWPSARYDVTRALKVGLITRQALALLIFS